MRRHTFLIALRQLLAHPFITLAAAITLGIGIGVSAAAFTLVSRVVLRPLPLHQPERLVSIWATVKQAEVRRMELSANEFDLFRSKAKSFDGLAAYAAANQVRELQAGTRRLTVHDNILSLNFFQVLGLRPLAGRFFTKEESEAKPPAVMMLSESAWERYFNRDPRVIGATWKVEGVAVKVIGVAPKQLEAIVTADIFCPMEGNISAIYGRANTVLGGIGRLRRGVTIDQARAELEKISATTPTDAMLRGTPIVHSVVDEVLGPARSTLWLLFALALMVLLIAITSAATLLITHGATRDRDFAVREALGISRGAIFAQLLVEGLMIAGSAALVGLALCELVLKSLSARAPQLLPRSDEVSIDLPVVLFALLCSVVVAFAFALLAAARIHAKDSAKALHVAPARVTASRKVRRVVGIMAACQVAVSLVVLTSAGLMYRRFVEISRTPVGFTPGNTLIASVLIPQTAFPREMNRSVAIAEINAHLRRNPKVEIAAATSLYPLEREFGWDLDYTIEGQNEKQQALNPYANLMCVTPGYFKALGIPLIEGREFAPTDRPPADRWRDPQRVDPSKANRSAKYSRPPDAPRSGPPRTPRAGGEMPAPPPPSTDPNLVAIVSESFAKRIAPQGSAIGKRVKFGPPSNNRSWFRIVGVVKDVQYRGLHARRLDYYLPLTQSPLAPRHLVVLPKGGESLAIEDVRAAARKVHPDIQIFSVRSSRDLMRRTIAPWRVAAILMALLAAIAVLLSTVGTSAAVAFAATAKRREIGIRIALGADRFELLALNVRAMAGTIVAGLALGVLLTVATNFGAERIYADAPSFDMTTLAASLAALVVVALAATLVPAYRYSGVDAMDVLREE